MAIEQPSASIVAFVPGRSSDFPLNLKRPDGDGHLRRLRKDFLDLQRSHLSEIAQEEAAQRLQEARSGKQGGPRSPSK